MTVKNELDNTYIDIPGDFTQLDETGDLRVIRGTDSIDNAVRQVVLSNWYDRPFKRKFGGDISRLVGDTISASEKKYFKDLIVAALVSDERRINIESVDVSVSELKNELYCVVVYSYKSLKSTVTVYFDK